MRQIQLQNVAAILSKNTTIFLLQNAKFSSPFICKLIKLENFTFQLL